MRPAGVVVSMTSVRLRKPADGLLHAPCRNGWKQSNLKQPAQLDRPPPKGAKQSKPRGRPRGADVT
jgi:hypothetical protein